MCHMACNIADTSKLLLCIVITRCHRAFQHAVSHVQAGKNIERATDDAKEAASDAYSSAKEKAR